MAIHLSPLLLALLGVLVLRYLFLKLQSVLFTPLAALPGRKWSLWTPLVFNVTSILDGRGHLRALEDHAFYGTVYRLNANTVHIADPELAKIVLRSVDFPKAGLYGFLKSSDEPANMFITSDKDQHRFLRRLASPAFSPTSVAAMEPLMMKTVQSLLCAQLDFDSGARDLVADFQNVALDVLGECCYGMSFDMVKNNTHPLIEARRELMQFVPMRIAFYLMFAWIPIGFRLDEWLLSFHPINAIQRFYRQFTIDVIARRKREMEEGNLPASSTEKRHDILQSLLDVGGDDPEENLSDIQIVSETNFFLTAGSETTALSMMWTVLLVYLDPVILAKLRRELDGAFPDVEFRRDLGTPGSVSFTPLPDETLRRLPYLDACIKEAMRFLPPAAMGFNRDTDVDCKLGGYQIPKGTTICVSLYTMHRSPELWERADEFWPERWIDPPEEDGGEGPKRCNRACYYPFSGGTRSCIAMNFAWQEMRLVLAHLFRYLDYEIPPDSQTLVAEARAYVTLAPKAGSTLLVKPRLREEFLGRLEPEETIPSRRSPRIRGRQTK